MEITKGLIFMHTECICLRILKNYKIVYALHHKYATKDKTIILKLKTYFQEIELFLQCAKLLQIKKFVLKMLG